MYSFSMAYEVAMMLVVGAPLTRLQDAGRRGDDFCGRERRGKEAGTGDGISLELVPRQVTARGL